LPFLSRRCHWLRFFAIITFSLRHTYSPFHFHIAAID
jgi:hypothetical protein